MELFTWLNDQLLRMDWLSGLVRVLLEDGLGLDLSSRVGASLHFFIYDVIKIFILLAVLIFSISWVQSYFPPERTRRILGGMSGFKARLSGALLGTITPFCSCSSIPLFIGFTSAGLPLGVTFAFLISSPLVDLASVILLASIFNWSIMRNCSAAAIPFFERMARNSIVQSMWVRSISPVVRKTVAGMLYFSIIGSATARLSLYPSSK